jgi:hypothetical protein
MRKLHLALLVLSAPAFCLAQSAPTLSDCEAVSNAFDRSSAGVRALEQACKATPGHASRINALERDLGTHATAEAGRLKTLESEYAEANERLMALEGKARTLETSAGVTQKDIRRYGFFSPQCWSSSCRRDSSA